MSETRSMSATTPPRPRPRPIGIGLPAVADVHPPRVVQRSPRWLVAGIALAVLLLFAFYLRTKELNGTLWFDEASAVGIATESFGGVLHATRVSGAAPLYYLLLHFWVSGFGDGVPAARWLSLLCALISVPVAGWAGWTLGGERAGFYAAALFAVSSILTQYSDQAQPYTLLGLLGLLATAAFLHAFVHRRRGYLWLLTFALTAALYTQGSAGLFLFGLGAAVIVVIACAEPSQRRGILRDAALCLVAVLVLYLPWLPATVNQIAHATSPWHYAPLLGAYLPADLVGGERVDAVLLVIAVLAVGPFVLVRSRRREPAAIMFYSLIAMGLAAILFAAVAGLAAPAFISRYLTPTASVMLLFSALGAARAKLPGFAAVLLVVIFCANPAAFATTHPSNMNEVAAQLGGRLDRGDVVAVAQPEQTPLAWYYLPSQLRWATTLGPVADPRYTDWDGAQARLAAAAPAATLGKVVASLDAGQQLLYIRPLTEGERNWRSAWASLVRLRAAQWGALLTADVRRGILTQVAIAPENYPGDCCVANSAILYRKTAS